MRKARCDLVPRRWPSRLVALAACVGVGAAASAATLGAERPAGPTARRWVVTDLGSLGGSQHTYTIAAAINDRGQVVGLSDTNQQQERDGGGHRIGHAFLWEKGRMRDLGTLGGDSSLASDINDRGQVVGCSTTRAGVTHAFLWERGRMRDLGTLGGTYSCASSINERGQIVGTSGPDPGFTARHAFLWSAGTMTDLGSFGRWGSDASAIDDRGRIVASRSPRTGTPEGLVWDDGRVDVLAGTRAYGSAINARGWIVGSAAPARGGAVGDEHAALWRDGSRTDIGTLGGRRSYAQGLNDSGLVVGVSERGCSRGRASVARAFVWEDGRMTALPGLPGLDITGATGVDDRGRIVGYASTGGGPRCVPMPRVPHVHAVMWTRMR